MTGTVSFINDIARFGFVTQDIPAGSAADQPRFAFGYSTHGEFAEGDEVTFDVAGDNWTAINIVKVVPVIQPVPPYIFPPKKYPLGAF